jgi:hypothetical protein
MAFLKLPLSATPSKAEKHTLTQPDSGMPDHDCEMALDQWRAAVGRLHHVLKRSEVYPPIAFVKNLDGAMPELRRAAMAVIICNQILNGEKGGI